MRQHVQALQVPGKEGILRTFFRAPVPGLAPVCPCHHQGVSVVNRAWLHRQQFRTFGLSYQEWTKKDHSSAERNWGVYGGLKETDLLHFLSYYLGLSLGTADFLHPRITSFFVHCLTQDTLKLVQGFVPPCPR